MYFGFSILNEEQCPYHLFLKECLVDPIYVFKHLSELTVALYITFSVLHLPGNEHLCLLVLKHLHFSLFDILEFTLPIKYSLKRPKDPGDAGDRTPGLIHAKHALYH